VRISFTTNQLQETLFWAFIWGRNAVIEEMRAAYEGGGSDDAPT
jgi:hypothetical protein